MSTLDLIRAVSAEFLKRKFVAAVIVFAVAGAIFTALLGWLVSMSTWWLVLAVPMFGLMLFSVLMLLVVRISIGIFRPQLDKSQKTAVSDFVDKLERVAEQVQMPPFMIFLNIARNVIRPRNTTFIASVIQDSKTLKPDFQALQKLF